VRTRTTIYSEITLRIYYDNFIRQSTSPEARRRQRIGSSRDVCVFELCTLDPSRLRSAVNRRDTFICFINTGATTTAAIRREGTIRETEGRSLSLSLSLFLSPRGSGGTGTMGPMTCYNCALAAQHGLLPASCQFECPIAFTLEALAGVYEGPTLCLECTLFLVSAISLPRRLSVPLSCARARARRTGDARLFRCEPRCYEPHSLLQIARGPEIRIVGIRDSAYGRCYRLPETLTTNVNLETSHAIIVGNTSPHLPHT